jgi:hypothetical protein
MDGVSGLARATTAASVARRPPGRFVDGRPRHGDWGVEGPCRPRVVRIPRPGARRVGRCAQHADGAPQLWVRSDAGRAGAAYAPACPPTPRSDATRCDAMRYDARQRCLPLHPVSVSLLGRWRGASTTRSLVSAHNLSRGVPHGFWLLGGECGRSSSRAASEVVARPPPAHRLPGRRGSSASLAGTGPILPPPQTHTLPLFLHLMPSPKSASSRRYY